MTGANRRVFFDDTVNEFHFYKKPVSGRYEAKGLHEIDVGIAMSHFELASVHSGLSGGWIRLEKERVKTIDDFCYIMTWKCKWDESFLIRTRSLPGNCKGN